MSTATDIRGKAAGKSSKMIKDSQKVAIDTECDLENGVNTYTFNDGSALSIEIETGRTDVTDARY